MNLSEDKAFSKALEEDNDCLKRTKLKMAQLQV